jgi:nucleotidyltransferase/DNA polymerase involved in DNA repair
VITRNILQGKPVAVCQYNNYRGGAIIAVDYEARKYAPEYFCCATCIAIHKMMQALHEKPPVA